MHKPPDAAARFWDKVDRRGRRECWPWLAYRRPSGHGRLKWDGRTESAYRVAFLLSVGPIPAGALVRHRCGNAWCVNPAHLELGDYADNGADRIRHRGKPEITPPPRKRWKSGPEAEPVKDRLLASISIDGAGCWIWTKARFHFGHGAMNVAGKLCKAHRVAFAEFVGPIPAGQQIRHTCDKPACINPAHLRLGTHADNMADMAARGRAAKGAGNHFGRVKYQGEANGFARLTAKAVREIRRSRLTLAALADKFGVSIGAISHVRARRNWRHIE